jgi:hypothetical protein
MLRPIDPLVSIARRLEAESDARLAEQLKALGDRARALAMAHLDRQLRELAHRAHRALR